MSASAHTWSMWVVVGPAVAAVVLALAAYPLRADHADIRSPLGPSDWDFGRSWAANLTVFSATLGVIIAAKLLPDTKLPDVTTNTFVALNILFGLVAIVGPFVYVVLQRKVTVTRVAGRITTTQTQLQGTLGGFLLGTAVTLWAVLGEFATVAELLHRIHRADTLPPAVITAFAVVLAAAALLVVAFLVTRIRGVVQYQTSHRIDGRTEYEAKLRVAGIAAPDLPKHRSLLPSVPVL